MATLNLPRDPRTAVWALLRDRLKADPVYADAGIRLVFFEGDPPGHVAIYVGNDMIVHAPHTGTVVQYASLDPKASDYIYMSVVGSARP